MPENVSIRLFICCVFLSSLVSAQHEHGGDSASQGGIMMVPFLHFTPGDALWFKEWIPRSKGAVAGACIGLFMLAIFERFLAGTRGVMESWWKKKTDGILLRTLIKSERCHTEEIENSGISSEGGSAEKGDSPASSRLSTPVLRRVLPPFIPSHDLTRAALQVGQSAVGYALMLAVMTFNASFIISILIGIFCGELMFGRFAGLASHS